MLALTFQIGPHRLALDTRCVKEVVPRVHLRQVASAPAWLAGVFVYRGRVVPVIDLHRLVGAGECPPLLSSRIILVQHSGSDCGELLGLLAAQVAEVRTLEPAAMQAVRLTETDQPDLGPVLADGNKVLHLLDLDHLLPSTARRQLQGISGEAP
jgi:chemotaxis-related protein WspB